MGYSLSLGDKDVVPLASITGWADVREWADGGPPDLVELYNLIDHGVSQELGALRADVKRAAADADGSVKDTLTQLAKTLAIAPKGVEAVWVSNGMGPDDDEPDDWVVGEDVAEEGESETPSKPCDCDDPENCECDH